ncbi:hypothetical protein [Alkalimarinus sediminis]|uniref:Uncharacterized protein n=1 Tax=Alkalimarinus sediminis TaxID=1632866 RepID=A0A9E8HPU9_9ALTE|nr:hypothetical protein [Alkalimarinus sediminis]UZW76533.1 hypothetical protein NNL22_08115 [Alkalimarinus sediminis]
MERDKGKHNSDDVSAPKPISGAAAFKPTTSKELDLARKREERKEAERKRVSEEQTQQHIRKKLLAECQTLLNVNYDWLYLDDYPDNRSVALAKRNRDYWLFICCVFFIVFCAGVLGVVPAWVGGSSFGLLFVVLCFALKPFRRFFSAEPTLNELLSERKKLEFRALNHIKLLEGQEGLAWKCRKLAKYNANLKRTLFQGAMDLSAKKRLFSVIREKKHIRLYLQLMLEAEKAYKRLQQDYLKHHFNNLEQGIDDTVDEQSRSVSTSVAANGSSSNTDSSQAMSSKAMSSNPMSSKTTSAEKSSQASGQPITVAQPDSVAASPTSSQ